MMVLRVVASRNGVGEVQLVTIKVPVTNEALRQTLVVLLNFGNGWAECTKIGGRPGRLSVLVENQPVWMLFHDVRQLVYAMVQDVFTAAIFCNERYPPQRDPNSSIVVCLHYFLEGIVRKGVGAGRPIPSRTKPASIKGRPIQTQFLKLR